VQPDLIDPTRAADLPYPMFEVKPTGRKGGAPMKTFLENLQAP
jgi:hypothetical protein